MLIKWQNSPSRALAAGSKIDTPFVSSCVIDYFKKNFQLSFLENSILYNRNTSLRSKHLIKHV